MSLLDRVDPRKLQRHRLYRALFSPEPVLQTDDAEVTALKVQHRKAAEYVLKDILNSCGVNRNSFFLGDDPADVAFREGQRAVALGILKILHEDPVAVVEKLTKEMNDE